MTSETEKAFMDQLLQSRLLISTGVPGVFGRGAVFEDVIQRFDQYITRSAKDDHAEVVRFPPVISRKHFETSEYLKSFPQLAGSVFSFEGSGEEHMKLLQAVHDGKDWSQYQKMTDVVLAPAACYPVYPTLAGSLPEGGKLFDVFSWCFRHEPSPDPARMQTFRMREFVRIGTFDAVQPWRDLWLERGKKLLADVGLGAAADTANDPFFGKGGRMLAANQREQKLKFELLIPICSVEKPTAIMSFNYHQDHFGHLFGIQTSKGEVAQTACVGFGMERIALALFKIHGLHPTEWPASVRAQLWPSGAPITA
jgi:seryl-tRNA synthetase